MFFSLLHTLYLSLFQFSNSKSFNSKSNLLNFILLVNLSICSYSSTNYSHELQCSKSIQKRKQRGKERKLLLYNFCWLLLTDMVIFRSCDSEVFQGFLFQNIQNITGGPKMQKNKIQSDYSFFQYCNSNYFFF